MLITRHLYKSYRRQVALTDVQLRLEAGVVALVGANGSGKSTLMRILATLLKPDSGEVWLKHWMYGRDERMLRQNIGYLPQDFELPEHLTPRTVLNTLADLRGAPEQVEPLMNQLNLTPFADQPARTLSGGQLRVTGIAQAFLNNPPLLLLDELTRGLDVVERERVFQCIRRSAQLVIFSTHVAEEAENLAGQIVVLHQGRVLFCGGIEELRRKAAGCVYELTIPAAALPQVSAAYQVSSVKIQNQRAIVRIISRTPIAQGVEVTPSLTDAYLVITARPSE